MNGYMSLCWKYKIVFSEIIPMNYYVVELKNLVTFYRSLRKRPVFVEAPGQIGQSHFPRQKPRLPIENYSFSFLARTCA